MMERIDSSLLEALRREPHPSELAREAETVAGMEAVVRSCVSTPKSFERRRGLMLTQSLRVRTIAILAATLLAATSAIAAAGSLPAPAQDVVDGVLGELGLSLPDQAGGADPAQERPDLPSAAARGQAIAELARTTEADGAAKGAAISETASEGKSQAGAGGAPEAVGEPPVETPNEGGTSTANTASGGASLDGAAGGTDTADAASGGRSAAGSGNAELPAGAGPPSP
jgi:hypothetical protein